jgi:hypothetical protein
MADLTYAVYVIAVEDTNEADEAVSDLPGLLAVERIEKDRSEEAAVRIVEEIYGGDYG